MIQALSPYLKIARFDHWFKNVFMLPGVLVALTLQPDLLQYSLITSVLLGLLAAGFVASSNYVINEILDADFDRLHPVKRLRPIPSGQVNLKWAYIEWIALAVIGLAIASLLGKAFFYTALALWVMGCFYNIPPIRTKDKAYLDVLSESVNNPLRLLLGWYSTGSDLVPPLSLLIAYWMLGAFFMAAKRYAEYQRIGDAQVAANYRASFKFYNAERLMISVIYYVVAFGLFLGIFLIRYRIELIILTPFIAGFVAWYQQLAYLPDSPVQYPEKLYKEKKFVLFTALCVVIGLIALFVDIPFLHSIFSPSIAIQ